MKPSNNDLSGVEAQKVLGRLLRSTEAEAELQKDANAYLGLLEVDEEQRAALLSVGEKRLLAYFRLVHNRIHNVVQDYLPLAAPRIPKGQLRRDVVRFIAEEGIKSPYFRSVPREAITWLSEQWKKDPSLPPYLSDLAIYELIDEDLRGDPNKVGESTEKALALDAPVRCNGTLRITNFDYAVQDLPALSKDSDALAEPKKESTTLFSFRTRNHKVKHLTVKARSVFLVKRLQQGEALQAALLGACADNGEELNDDILATTALTLADLSEREVLLGAE